MKKLLSILLIGTLLASLPCLQAFATSSVAEQSSSTEMGNETPSGNQCNDFTVLDESLSNFEHCDSIQSTDTIFSQNQSFSTVSVHFNETSETFLQKITSDIFTIDGNVSEENEEIVSLTDYFAQKKVSRFDIVEIAYQNNLITENEKIETYCKLIENQQFENASCLHSVILMLLQYQSSETSLKETNQRIEQIFSHSSSPNDSISRSTSDDENLSSVSSRNFIIEYEAGIARSEVVKVANYLETVRNKYVNEMGYRAPILESSQTKYSVTLRTGASDDLEDPFGLTFAEDCYGVTYSTRIEIYYFTSLTAQFKEVIAHEFFHAIQGSYFWNTFLANIWFSEATAAWATIAIQETTSTLSEEINGYLSDTGSLVYFYYMGAVLFPLVMQDLCDTSDVIRKVWEEYGTLTSTNSMLEDLRSVIDTVLSPYGESFDSVYLTMGYYNFSPSYWYSSLHPEGTSVTDTWIPRIDHQENTVSDPRNDCPIYTEDLKKYIPLHSHQYYKFIPDIVGINSKINIDIEFFESDAAKGTCYFYYVTEDGVEGIHPFTQSTSNTNKYSYTSTTYGGDILWCGIIVTNTSTQNTISYTLKYLVERGTEQTLSFGSNLRYYEKVEDIGKAEYKDFYITFATGGNKLIQTFGNRHAYIALYDENSTFITSDNESGYEQNALISYNFEANKQYRLRVMFYSYIVYGEIKLAILPSTSYSTFENIPAYTDYTSGISGPYTQNQVDVITYKRTTQTTVKVHIEATIDSYLYIINPGSVDPIVAANNSSPNLTKDLEALYNDNYNSTYSSEITKTMLADVPYLIIACKYNPASTVNGSYLLAFQ